MGIDWNHAPEGAEFYALGAFRRQGAGEDNPWIFDNVWRQGGFPYGECLIADDYEPRPAAQQWPEETRIDRIGTNGNTGEHYEEAVPFVEWSKAGEFTKPTEPKTSVEFLNACAAVQSERGKQYDASGTGERSFAAAASAFNAATGKSLTGSDVCLLLTMVKLVRQYSSPDRLHHDSLLDGVSYLSLWAEELTKELGA
jgi:hypothetical protein